MDDYFDDDTEDDDDISFEDTGILPPSSSTVSKDHFSTHQKAGMAVAHESYVCKKCPLESWIPILSHLSAVMNAWAKTKSAQGASMVEMWLNRAQQEYDAGNHRIVPTAKLYTMAGMYHDNAMLEAESAVIDSYSHITLAVTYSATLVDAWAKSGEGGAAATRAEAILQHMNQLYQSGGHDTVKPTTGIFNAVINAWARSREKIAPMRAEQILGVDGKASSQWQSGH